MTSSPQEKTARTHYEFRICPVPKPRMTQRDQWLSPPRPAVAKYRAFADQLRAAATKLRFTMPESGASIRFVLPMPKSWGVRKSALCDGAAHTQRPDLDNLVKSVLDALLGEDCRVWHLASIEKRWGLSGSITIISPLQES